MNDLKTIQKINSLVESAKQRVRARAMNNPGGHPKDAEKGRACKRCGNKRRVFDAAPAGQGQTQMVAVRCPDCSA